MPLKTTRFDAADYIQDDETIALFLDEALSDGDPRFIANVVVDVARAIMRQLTSLSKIEAKP